MNDLECNSTNPVAAAAASAHEDRRPYLKPSFRFEQVFETMALQCGKIEGTSQACNMVKMAS